MNNIVNKGYKIFHVLYPNGYFVPVTVQVHQVYYNMAATGHVVAPNL